MKIIADLHVHSKFSRATARDLDLENLYVAAQIKGIQLVGTGDFSHPDWFSEIEAKLEPAEAGLLRMKADAAKEAGQSCSQCVRGANSTAIRVCRAAMDPRLHCSVLYRE